MVESARGQRWPCAAGRAPRVSRLTSSTPLLAHAVLSFQGFLKAFRKGHDDKLTPNLVALPALTGLNEATEKLANEAAEIYRAAAAEFRNG